MTIMSFASFGYEGEIIKVEADLRRGLPLIDIVGLPGSAVKEARERMRAAINNAQLPFPQERILINLSPADQKKEGSGFDLPITLAVLQAGSTVDTPVMVIGELELSGRVRPVHGVLGAILSGAAAGISFFIVPKENEAEACIQEGVQVYGVETLQQAVECLTKLQHIPPAPQIHDQNGTLKTALYTACTWSKETDTDKAVNTGMGGFFEDVQGQKTLVRALHIAAAGGHSVLAYGPPGCGKTLSMQRFASLLPDMDVKTAEEVTRIYSIAGLLRSGTGHAVLIKRPPFRMPHPNASLEGMIGGAGKCLPGEISLAHGGVLFLDEAVQFKTTVLQTLRAPMETGTVTLSRAGRSSTFPARFQLLMALNSCPCGNLGADNKICTCMPALIETYWKKLTAPLIDRIDLRIPVFPPHSQSLLNKSDHNTEHMRNMIAKADRMQKERYYEYQKKCEHTATGILYKNTHLIPELVSPVCRLTQAAEHVFTKTAAKKGLSGRGSHAILKIARTIADLDQEDTIAQCHIEEAISMREWSSFLPDFLH